MSRAVGPWPVIWPKSFIGHLPRRDNTDESGNTVRKNLLLAVFRTVDQV